MTREEHLLTIAIEECNEVAQRLSKALRFGLSEVQPGQSYANDYRVIVEYNDLIAVLRMLNLEVRDPRLIAMKREKVEHFLSYSVDCGTLAADPPVPQEPKL